MPRPPKQPIVSKQEVAHRLRALRQMRGLRQVELARLLGVSQSNVSHIEGGRQGITIHQAVKLAKALRVSVDEILVREKAPKAPRSLRSGRLLRSLQIIEQLPAADQRSALEILEGIIAKHRIREMESKEQHRGNGHGSTTKARRPSLKRPSQARIAKRA